MIFWIMGGVILLLALVMLATHLILKARFPRGMYPTEPVADYYYDHYRDAYPREHHSFRSGKRTLSGYLYGAQNTKGLIVFAHGIGLGHESYLQELLWMVDHGWRVFAYDATGCGESEGSGTRGLVQSALDLDAALTYVESKEEFAGLPICLMGHSWGGYAVAAGLYFEHKIVASASISGYALPLEMMMRFAKATMGKWTALLRPFVSFHNLLLFGKYAKLTAIDGINRTDTPIMLIHGTGDELILYDVTAIISKKDLIKNSNVVYYTVKDEGQNGHMTIFYDEGSVAYIKKVNADLQVLVTEHGGQISKEVRAAFFDGVDRELINHPNQQLLSDIDRFFEEKLPKNKNS